MKVSDDGRIAFAHQLHDLLERAFRSVMLLPINGFGPIAMPMPVQLVVALWAAKTSFLIERSVGYIRGEQVPDAGPSPFRWMRERSEPPPQTQVWIGAVDAKPAKLISFVATQWVGADDPPVGIIQVFTIGYVLFVLYSPVGFSHLPAPAQTFALDIGGETANFLREIWPHKADEVEWPPPGIFSADQLEVMWPSGGRIRARLAPPD